MCICNMLSTLMLLFILLYTLPQVTMPCRCVQVWVLSRHGLRRPYITRRAHAGHVTHYAFRNDQVLIGTARSRHGDKTIQSSRVSYRSGSS